jgi:hypothetical protein
MLPNVTSKKIQKLFRMLPKNVTNVTTLLPVFYHFVTTRELRETIF